MLPKKLDTTLALKAICLTDKLTGTEKRFAVALLDHFNRKTGRCDPSYETLAKLLGVNRRTVGSRNNKGRQDRIFYDGPARRN